MMRDADTRLDGLSEDLARLSREIAQEGTDPEAEGRFKMSVR